MSKKNFLYISMYNYKFYKAKKASMSKGFSCKTDFNRHVERHSSQPAHTCKECGKLFGTKQDMLRHVKV